MNEQQIYEIVKAFAYGATPELVSETEEISIDEASKIASDHATEIEETRAELKNGGFIE